MDVELVGRSSNLDRRALWLATIADLRAWPSTIPVSRPFVAFTALDTRAASPSLLGAFAVALLEQGCEYACCWGDDCSRLHDIFDEVAVQREIEGPPIDTIDDVVMTTWHENDSLDEALWFAINCAFLAHHDLTAVVCIAAPRYATAIRARLEDPDQLNEDVVALDA